MDRWSCERRLVDVFSRIRRVCMAISYVRSKLASVALAAALSAAGVGAVQSTAAFGLSADLLGPAGSERFGEQVLVLSNGNFVVVDSRWDSPTQVNVGAVDLYNGATNSRISSVAGASANDAVGSGGVFEVGAGNFVVVSPAWANGAVLAAGAVTWVNGTSGLNAVVSPGNSLVGTSANDSVGSDDVTVLTNGNYVVGSPGWSNGAAPNAGAVTWGSGATGVVGAVTASNSLVGSSTEDFVGLDGVTALTNGNYVAASGSWDNGSLGDVGAATWGSGTSGVAGAVSAANSFIGSVSGTNVAAGGATALTNGNYVIVSPGWDSVDTEDVGAVTFVSGSAVSSGSVSTANSWIGTEVSDRVGGGGVTALANGNYVIASPTWDNGAIIDAGAATFATGAGPSSGVVSATNSLVGSAASDLVGSEGAIALSNGNYVVVSSLWDGGAADVGAVTWGSGTTGLIGAVSGANSLVGSTLEDRVGSEGIAALKNGNYVVGSANWNNGAIVDAGAATWRSGASAAGGVVSAANSLVGSTATDGVGSGVTALTNGNYVVRSHLWNNGAIADVGAATWGNGASGIVGAVTAANSLVGTTLADSVGSSGISALGDGNYVVGSELWNNGGAADAGAATWADGATGLAGTVSAANSLVGSRATDNVGMEVTASIFGNYAVISPNWDNAAVADAGAVTYAAAGGVVGVVTSTNSALGTPPGQLLAVSDRRTTAGMIVVATSQNRVPLLQIGATSTATDYVSVAPARLADTRPTGQTVDTSFAAGGFRGAGSTLELTVAGRGNVADDAAAVALNITAVDPVDAGYATVFPCGATPPDASNVNFAGATIPNAVVSKLSAAGKVCIFVSAATHLLVDVNGYFPSTGSLRSLNPARLLDTRPRSSTIDGAQADGGISPAGSVTTINVNGRATVPADAAAVVLNVTVVDARDAGFVTVYPCGGTPPDASNINYTAGLTIAGLAIAKVSSSGSVCIYTSAATHLVADVGGYFPSTTSYGPLEPARLLDTRPTGGTIDSAFVGANRRPAGTVTELAVAGRGGVPVGVETVVLNVTVTAPTAAGYITVYPCGTPPPDASSVNYDAGTTIANAVAAQLSATGTVCLFNSAPTQLLVDVNGYFAVAGGAAGRWRVIRTV
jgi:trimeric autotransporter adhesin